jgi:ADP-ribosylation factor-like protein 2
MFFWGRHQQYVFYRYRLNIWDVGGQKSIRPFWMNYFENTDGIVWVVDSSDGTRLETCKIELKRLLEEEVSEKKKD